MGSNVSVTLVGGLQATVTHYLEAELVERPISVLNDDLHGLEILAQVLVLSSAATSLGIHLWACDRGRGGLVGRGDVLLLLLLKDSLVLGWHVACR